MLKEVSQSYQTLYSELAQRALDSSFVSEFDPKGRFVSVKVKDRKYWYFDAPDGRGGQKRSYVGPFDDPEITSRVDNFIYLKNDIRERRKLISTLTREAHLPRPDKMAGDIVELLESEGFFRLRGVLVGTVAFQCYPSLVGVRMPKSHMATSDADFAKFHSISIAINDSMGSVLECLKKIDQSFREIPHQSDGRFTTKYINKIGYQVEFLTANNGSDEHIGRPTRMPSLGGTSAEPLRFLDFLIHQPVRAVLLHGAGIPVLVPSPERYAIHKLIVASRRRKDEDGTVKSRKDLSQATVLMRALIHQRQQADLAEAYIEAHNRGPAWRDAIKSSLNQIDDNLLASVKNGIAHGMDKIGEDKSKYNIPEP